MPIEQEPFKPYHEEKKTESFTVKLNAEERAELNAWKNMIHQPKDSTCMKQLARIGAKVIQRPETAEFLGVIFNNDRKNRRTGLNEWE